MKKVYMHINYWEKKGELEKAFQIASMNGYKGIELRMSGESVGLGEDRYKDEICRLKDKYPELALTFGCPADFVVEDISRRNRDEEKVISFMLWAENNLSTKFFNFFTGNMTGADYIKFDLNGSAMATEGHYRQVAGHLSRVGEALRGRSLKIALESHNCYIHDLPDAICKLLGMVRADNVGVNLDYGNIFLHKLGGSLEEAVEKLREKIFYVHLKNLIKITGAFWVTRLADGMIDNFQFVSLLKKIGYEGPVCLEFPGQGDHFTAAARDITYFNSIGKSIWGISD